MATQHNEPNTTSPMNPTNSTNPMEKFRSRLTSLDPRTKQEVERAAETMMYTFKSGASMPVNELKNEVSSGMTNGLSPIKEYRHLRNFDAIATEIVVAYAMHEQNKHIINRINYETMVNPLNAGSVVTVQTLQKTQDSLYRSGVAATRDFKLGSYDDYKRMQDQMNVVSSRAGYGDITKLDNARLDALDRRLNNDISSLQNRINDIKSGKVKLKKLNGEELSPEKVRKEIDKLENKLTMARQTKELVDPAKQMNNTFKGNNKLATNRRMIKASVKRAVLSTVSDSEGYQGYQTLKQTKDVTKAVVKASFTEFKGIYKLSKFEGGKLRRPAGAVGRYVLQKSGAAVAHVIGQARFQAMARGATKAAHGAARAAKHVTGFAKSVASTPAKVKLTVRNSRVILSDRVRNVGNTRILRVKRRIVHSRVLRPVVGARLRIRRTMSRFGRSRIGRGMKFIGRGIGKVISAPFKFVGFLTRSIFSFVKMLVDLILKLLAGLCVLLFAISVILSAVAAVISSITTILDGASNSYDEFIHNTTMGKTYSLLLTKEEDFKLALKTVPDDVEIPQEFQEKYGISTYTAMKPTIIDGNGNATSNSQTIKGILSMGAIYVDQDFTKYGSLAGNSTYRDYCTSLYDSTHIIGITDPNMDGSDIYHCSDPTKKEALADCNNKTIKGRNGSYYMFSWDDDVDEEYLKLRYSAVFREYGSNGSYDCIKEGPHGSSTEYTDRSNKKEKYETRRKRLEEMGCHSYIEVQVDYQPEEWDTKIDNETGEPKDYISQHEKTTYQVFCTCQTCVGHVDANVYGFVSNIYDPSIDIANITNDSYDNVDNSDVEMKYSMYALDRFATAFDDSYSIPCTLPGCDGIVNFTGETAKCPVCRTVNTFNGNIGDAESIAEAETKAEFAAEKEIMEDILGEEVQIVNWWEDSKNFLDGLNDLISGKTIYYRLLKNGDIEGAKPSDNDKNVVNKKNSDAYHFTSTLSKQGRNHLFAKHGWDEDSITLVRLLMAGDWTELYAISDFGGVGTGFTDAQISQMMSNNISWNELCDDRKAIVYTTLKFYSELKRLNVNYHGSGCYAPSLEALSEVNSKDERNYFRIGYPNNICSEDKVGKYKCDVDKGVDCSGFVSWILSRVFFPNDSGKMNIRETTSSLHGLVGTTLTRIGPYDSILPGDIALKDGHVMLYMGNMEWAEAAGHADGILIDNIHSFASLSSAGYKFYKVSCIDEEKNTFNPNDFSNQT